MCFLAACAAAIYASGGAHAAVPLERFVDKLAIVTPKLSPNGRYLATPVRKGENLVIAVHDLDAPKGTQPSLISTDDEVDWIEWASDDRILISLTGAVPLRFRGYGSTLRARPRYKTRISRIVAVSRDGTKPLVLMTPDRRFNGNRDLTLIAHMLPDAPEEVLMAANDTRSRFSLYRVNVYTGALDRVTEGTIHTDSWLTDIAGVPRVRWDYDWDEESFQMYARRGDGEDWDKIGEYGERDFPDMNIVGFADDPKIAIVTSRQAGDRFGLYEYDLAARKLGRLLFAHPQFDVGAPFGNMIYDPETKRLLGLTYVEDLWRVHYFDQEFNMIQGEADALFPDVAVVRLRSWSNDHARAVVYAEGPKNPGSYYLLDRKAKTNELIGRVLPQLPATELGDISIIKYPARDGTKLTGYLTLPPDRGDRNLPMVVMPHGGPELRDAVQYDDIAQAIANRGYLVFQPNFRGSGGYGRAFAEAGHRQWGRRMQDDITDGVRALIADGSADGNRVCIVGGSYGGYAALAGGAFTPDLYKCIVSFAGVSNLTKLVESERKEGVKSSTYRYLVKRVGDPSADRAEMEAWSPAHHADKFVAPVLLIHGEWDDIVSFEQSVIMEGALSRAGKKVKLVKVKEDGHHFRKRGSRLKLLTETLEFLAVNLKN